MEGDSAYEVRHKGKVYRALNIDVLVRWAKERRISSEDLYRKTGAEEWHPITESKKLSDILDPENWWTLRMDGQSYPAPDFETLLKWAREGRISTKAEIEGPQTPPGGVLASGLPRLAPYLKKPMEGGDEGQPPRLWIDGKEYRPGDVDTAREWIVESRVPPEAKISLNGGDWEPVGECGLFEPELWPEGAWGEVKETEEEPVPAEEPPSEAAEGEKPEVSQPAPEESGEPLAELGDEQLPAEAEGEPYVVTTLQGEFLIRRPGEIRKLLRKKKAHNFDQVRHPSLPSGACSVEEFMSMTGVSRRRGGLWIWLAAVILLAVAIFLVWDPLALVH
ncbi:hypothetical protein GF402_07175 [Candidatus Fermentibacteria bacterium]|nr:hypothetical protein [Candidatus Fermentibacteria bacterium]